MRQVASDKIRAAEIVRQGGVLEAALVKFFVGVGGSCERSPRLIGLAVAQLHAVAERRLGTLQQVGAEAFFGLGRCRSEQQANHDNGAHGGASKSRIRQAANERRSSGPGEKSGANRVASQTRKSSAPRSAKSGRQPAST